jgi:hypothetical protein
MKPQRILQLLRKRPFDAFRIHLSDGSSYDIQHPELAIVERNKVIVGVPGSEGPDGLVERSVFSSLLHISRAEWLDGDSRAGSTC